MPDIVYKNELAASLQLNLLRGCADESLFTILQTGTLSLGNLSIRAHIIGASHLITYDLGGQCFTELLACSEATVHLGQKIFCGDLPELIDTIDLSPCENVSYVCRAELRDWEEAEHLRDELRDEISSTHSRPHEIGLVSEFPGQNGFAPAPETFVLVCARTAADVRVRTLHSYPNDRQLVFTSTQLLYVR